MRAIVDLAILAVIIGCFVHAWMWAETGRHDWWRKK